MDFDEFDLKDDYSDNEITMRDYTEQIQKGYAWIAFVALGIFFALLLLFGSFMRG